jgi:hypothetical protein
MNTTKQGRRSRAATRDKTTTKHSLLMGHQHKRTREPSHTRVFPRPAQTTTKSNQTARAPAHRKRRPPADRMGHIDTNRHGTREGVKPHKQRGESERAEGGQNDRAPCTQSTPRRPRAGRSCSRRGPQPGPSWPGCSSRRPCRWSQSPKSTDPSQQSGGFLGLVLLPVPHLAQQSLGP